MSSNPNTQGKISANQALQAAQESARAANPGVAATFAEQTPNNVPPAIRPAIQRAVSEEELAAARGERIERDPLADEPVAVVGDGDDKLSRLLAMKAEIDATLAEIGAGSAIVPHVVEEDPTLDEIITVDVYDADTDDYVPQEMTRRAYLQVTEPQDCGPANDPFALGPAYSQGDFARFDHFWASTDDQGMRSARAEGWVPVRVGADHMHMVGEHGVQLGPDTVLCKRPKELRRVYEQKRTAAAAAMVGDVQGDLEKTANGQAKIVGEGFTVEGQSPKAARQINENVLDRVNESRKAAATGRSSFYFERNPIHEERARKAAAAK